MQPQLARALAVAAALVVWWRAAFARGGLEAWAAAALAFAAIALRFGGKRACRVVLAAVMFALPVAVFWLWTTPGTLLVAGSAISPTREGLALAWMRIGQFVGLWCASVWLVSVVQPSGRWAHWGALARQMRVRLALVRVRAGRRSWAAMAAWVRAADRQARLQAEQRYLRWAWAPPLSLETPWVPALVLGGGLALGAV